MKIHPKDSFVVATMSHHEIIGLNFIILVWSSGPLYGCVLTINFLAWKDAIQGEDIWKYDADFTFK